ncbi:MAG: tryptophan--tRNA ligase [Candidatus Shapirobacteria bacterium]|nr:tryptophan--tRNA ligase [Candidatus Shapirobacteria bacterium]MDD5073600.1 tryptophan--tRNA ligase [Candidatus Shapirobacteria bacterium]MDD5481353.1 tryptophan--tRNA ligase [Candidatus Shapirobacteria bacterium]
MSSQKRVFSGIQPSGNLHLGNYIGAISQWVNMQDQYDCFFCIVDLHAITVSQDPQKLLAKIKELAALYLACGLDPKKSTIFVQSHNPDHASLTWILDCLTSMGQLERMTQYKTKSDQAGASVGLFNYPILMAADILLYQTDLVPVGQDQKQHVELTRDLAQKFNSCFGPVFKIPKPKMLSVGAKIMSLQNPKQKMSKSSLDKRGTIDLLDSPQTIKNKIMAAVTDSGQEIIASPNKPGISNLLAIYSITTGLEINQIEKRYQDKNYGQFKSDLAQEVVKFLTPIQDRYRTICQNQKGLAKILTEGKQKAKEVSQKTLDQVYQKTGLR